MKASASKSQNGFKSAILHKNQKIEVLTISNYHVAPPLNVDGVKTDIKPDENGEFKTANAAIDYANYIICERLLWKNKDKNRISIRQNCLLEMALQAVSSR